MRPRVCVIGAGPAGLMAAICAAQAGAETVVVESNTTAGRKLLLTGGGRCNLTHAGNPDELVLAYGPHGRFLRHSLHVMSPAQVQEFFEQLGVTGKVDATGCVFPCSERAGDVRDALVGRARGLAVRLVYDRPATHIEKTDVGFLVHAGRDAEPIVSGADRLILATGGLSYPQTGSRGDGFRFARQLGHEITPPRPCLVPLVTQETWPAELAGTALESVALAATVGGSKATCAGPMVFANDGIGGPAVLDLSRWIADLLPAKEQPIRVMLDTVPHLDGAELERQFIAAIGTDSRKTIANILSEFVPRRLAVVLCRQAGCRAIQANQLSREMRKALVRRLKASEVSIVRARGIDEATVTRGGVSTDQIDPRTMESRIVGGLFFAGELIDVDGPCGGYNLQICWSTGCLAGQSAGRV